MRFDSDKIESLRQFVKDRISLKRYNHTLGVEKMAVFLGDIIMPDSVSELQVAALLHDIAKEIPFDEQLELLKDSGVDCTEEDISTKPALHSFAAVPYISRYFAEYATPGVTSAVCNHTLGSYGMSLFDEIIYISDYAESGRTYFTCIEVNKFLLKNISKDKTYEENVQILHAASLKATQYTIDSLKKRGEPINSRTFDTLKYLSEFNIK